MGAGSYQIRSSAGCPISAEAEIGQDETNDDDKADDVDDGVHVFLWNMCGTRWNARYRSG
jgi:hypothetical protein